MGPKKNKTQQNEETSQKCEFYNRGYCKNGEDCDYKHPEKVCLKANCFNEKCHDRHPNPCWWGLRCKFHNKNMCLFSHDTTVQNDEKRVGELEKLVAKLQKESKMQNEEFKDLMKKMENKFDKLEDKIEKQHKTLQEKEKLIKNLENKLETLEDSFVTKLNKLEKLSEENKNKFKCEKCSFVTNSENGLKTHVTKKHKDKIEMNEKNFPQQCSLCDETLDNLRDLKKHMRTHSYKHVQFKCNLCEFVGGDDHKMEVHLAKAHGDKIECGLCEYEAKDLEALEIHLLTCECYNCGLCEKRMYKFTDIKTHFLSKHKASENHRGVVHAKPSRENHEAYETTFHSFISLFPDLGDKKSEKTGK